VITGGVAPLFTLNFSTLIGAMITFALQQKNAALYEDFDFSREVQLFAIRQAGLGFILLVFSYISIMFANYTAHNQVFRSYSYRN
jgi:hypothetical protein